MRYCESTIYRNLARGACQQAVSGSAAQHDGIIPLQEGINPSRHRAIPSQLQDDDPRLPVIGYQALLLYLTFSRDSRW
jgi:hypothetical protein